MSNGILLLFLCAQMMINHEWTKQFPMAEVYGVWTMIAIQCSKFITVSGHLFFAIILFHYSNYFIFHCIGNNNVVAAYSVWTTVKSMQSFIKNYFEFCEIVFQKVVKIFEISLWHISSSSALQFVVSAFCDANSLRMFPCIFLIRLNAFNLITGCKIEMNWEK